jgi:hypothetical protein
MLRRMTFHRWGRTVVQWIGALAMCSGIALAGCGTLAVTEEPAPQIPARPIPARLGVHITGEALKKAFADPTRRKLGLGPGQYFTDVVLLPPDTRYIAPQDILDQFGVDLILQLQITDTKSSADMNAIFIAAIPLTFGEPLAPIMSYEVTVTLETNLRDARTARLLWAKTDSTLASDHFSPIGPEEKIAGLAQRGLHNAVVKVFETLKQELTGYEPGAAPRPAAAAGGGAALSRVEKELKALEEQERRAEEQKKEEMKKLAALQQQIEDKKKRIAEEKKSRAGDSAALGQAEKELKALEEQERQVEEQKTLATVQQQIEEKKRRVEEERKKLEKVVGTSGQPAGPQANRYAIVVGIEQYRERIPKADFAERDARDMAQFLAKRGGYREENVIVRLNEQATKSDLEKYFEAWLRNNVDANSSVFIYFSGHGAPKAETGEAYIVPYDGDPAFIEQTGYPLKRLYQALDKLPTKNVVVMLDSCFSGTGGRSVLAKGARPMALTVEGLSYSGTRAVVLSATSGSHISLADQEKGHGLFTFYALQGLGGDADANGDGAIDVQELFEFLKPQVQRVARRVYNTEQVPQLIIPSGLVSQPPFRLIER